MKIIKQSVYRVEYCTDYDSNGSELVEANSLIEALEIATDYLKNTKKTSKFDIKGVHEYAPILKPISKTVTQTITVEL